MIGTWELVLRIGVGAILGGVIGFERDLRHKPVGLRTHLIVALASATFTVVSTHFVYWQHYGKDDLVQVDTSRIAASVVSAIGFLAAGAILRTGITVHGLTTAAGLWLVTAIGMCAGMGMFLLATIATAMGMLALTVLRHLEDKDDHVVRRRLSVLSVDGPPGVARVIESLRAIGATVSEVEYDRRLHQEKPRVIVTLDVRTADSVEVTRVIDAVESVPGVRRVRVRPAP